MRTVVENYMVAGEDQGKVKKGDKGQGQEGRHGQGRGDTARTTVGQARAGPPAGKAAGKEPDSRAGRTRI